MGAEWRDAHRIEALAAPLPDLAPVAAADIEQTLTGLIPISEKSGQERDPFRSSASFEGFSFAEKIANLRYFAYLRSHVAILPSLILETPNP